MFKITLSISFLFVIILGMGLPQDVAAAPLCSQINANDFCYPCLPGTATIEWRGDCANLDREWQCHWTCGGPGGTYSDWIPCNCPGEGGGCDCLMAGTPVTMADGSTKPVEQIKVGDMVMSYDESTGFLAPAPGSTLRI